MTSKDYKNIIADEIKKVLQLRRFKKVGNSFKLSNGDLTYYIELQSSMSSTANFLNVTVNIRIASDLLFKLEGKYATSHLQAQFSKRIGNYLEVSDDKWWTIDSEEAAVHAAREITELITVKVLAEFDKIRTTENLISYWKQGNYAGLTDYLMKKYLSLWENAQISGKTSNSM